MRQKWQFRNEPPRVSCPTPLPDSLALRCLERGDRSSLGMVPGSALALASIGDEGPPASRREDRAIAIDDSFKPPARLGSRGAWRWGDVADGEFCGLKHFHTITSLQADELSLECRRPSVRGKFLVGPAPAAESSHGFSPQSLRTVSINDFRCGRAMNDGAFLQAKFFLRVVCLLVIPAQIRGFLLRRRAIAHWIVLAMASCLIDPPGKAECRFAHDHGGL